MVLLRNRFPFKASEGDKSGGIDLQQSVMKEKQVEGEYHGEKIKTNSLGQPELSDQGMRACKMEKRNEKVLQSVSPPNKKIEAEGCLREIPGYPNSLQSANKMLQYWLCDTKTEIRDLDHKHVVMDIAFETQKHAAMDVAFQKQQSSEQKFGCQGTGREGLKLVVEGNLRDNTSNDDQLGSYNSHGGRRLKIEDDYPSDPGITRGNFSKQHLEDNVFLRAGVML